MNFCWCKSSKHPVRNEYICKRKEAMKLNTASFVSINHNTEFARHVSQQGLKEDAIGEAAAK